MMAKFAQAFSASGRAAAFSRRWPRHASGQHLGAAAPRLVELGLVVLLGLLLLRLGLAVVSPLPAPRAAADPAGGRELDADMSVFSRFDPFASATPATAVPEQEYAAAAETSLDLRLIGTYLGEVTTATIRTPDGKQQVFRTDEEIVPGVVLRDVLPEKAILGRNGVVETLSLQGRDQRGKASPTRARPQQLSAPAPRRQPQIRAPGGNPTPAETVALMARSFEFRPARGENGGAQGFAVYPGMDPSLFRNAGFAEGDVVVALNGRPSPTDPQSLLELMAELPPGRPVTVTVERDGVALDVPLDLKVSR